MFQVTGRGEVVPCRCDGSGGLIYLVHVLLVYLVLGLIYLEVLVLVLGGSGGDGLIYPVLVLLVQILQQLHLAAESPGPRCRRRPTPSAL